MADTERLTGIGRLKTIRSARACRRMKLLAHVIADSEEDSEAMSHLNTLASDVKPAIPIPI